MLTRLFMKSAARAYARNARNRMSQTTGGFNSFMQHWHDHYLLEQMIKRERRRRLIAFAGATALGAVGVTLAMRFRRQTEALHASGDLAQQFHGHLDEARKAIHQALECVDAASGDHAELKTMISSAGRALQVVDDAVHGAAEPEGQPAPEIEVPSSGEVPTGSSRH